MEYPRRTRISLLAEAKAHGDPITAISAYDALTAQLVDQAGIDVIVVSNIIGEEILGRRSRVEVELPDLEMAVKAVSEGAHRALIVAGLPFGGYETGETHALKSAIALMKCGAHAVTFEGGRSVADQVTACATHGIPVIGHIGFTARSMNVVSGPEVDDNDELVEDAVALAEAGAAAIILDQMPSRLAARISEIVDIPTIGFASGPSTSGQFLRITDVTGMSQRNLPHAPAFGQVGIAISQSIHGYIDSVKSGTFPAPPK